MAEKIIYARAKPASVKISEAYFFEKTLSRNPFIGHDQSPVGKIEILMPYDGDQYFTRQAYRDVKKQLNTKAPLDSQEARFGHLAFTDYEKTNLRQVLGLSNRYDSLPLSIPILGQGITRIEQLYDDTYTSKITFKYAPNWPNGWPIDILLELWDEETLNSGAEDQQLAQVAEQINKQINFLPSLLIKTRLLLDLPSHIVREGMQPRLTQISLQWPAFTSFRGVHLGIGPTPTEENRVMYNPQTRSLEWGNLPMKLILEESSAALKVFGTEWNSLLIDYPGELYRKPSIEGQASIEIPGFLLSGTQVRLFGATGELVKDVQPNAVSYLNIKFKLLLDEAFAKRKRSPYQHLYFDEVVPDKMRIADIKTAIADRGFRILPDKSLEEPGIRYFIKAERSDGPDKMELSIFIEGTLQGAERETQVKGGQTFKSSTESGDLKVYIRGEMHGNSQRLTQEMNALHASLHERFERLRSRR
ncbi:MAG TPA: hypothetical protein VK249_21400 [Anaerolineales bacterium]|nr:hypothetical protein [Anaerolineales bacterium]